MSESPSADDSDSVMEDLPDDGGLTIRIPNPKHYMARQSQWKGRRGKPRCDHCRINNLKCDRVLPTCNHCSWASGRDCKYTPLPTPAHRGIPRCDRCRVQNLKCDRNLPVCNHCAEYNNAECNYTPKKRHKVPGEHGHAGRQMAPYGSRSASFLVSDMMVMDGRPGSGDDGGLSFYGQNVGSSSQFGTSPSPSADGEGSSEPEIKTHPSSNRHTPENSASAWSLNSREAHSASKPPQPTKSLSFISHSFPGDQGVLVTKSHVNPWSHPQFAPLPEHVWQRLNTVNSIEMPNRHVFDESLSTFVASLMDKLRETAAFMPDIYAKLCRYIARGDTSKLSPRMQSWASFHHVRSGSDKYCLLLMPRDAYFDIDAKEEEKLRVEYVSRVDGKGKAPAMDHYRCHNHSNDSVEHGLDALEWTAAFERIPVQLQIYDILVYAHRAHGTPSYMLFEARRLGIASITWPMADMFVRLCPLCNLRGKQSSSHVKADKVESANSSPYESVMGR